jgi:limonene-1,2-epoxide hydrolase
MDAEEVVNRFIDAIGRRDQAEAMALVADDCYYDNVPIGDMTGKDKMAEFLAPMFKGSGPLTFEVHRQTASGKIVMNERTDRFVMRGKEIALPVAGVFEVTDGKISFWRDYFDNGMFTEQMKK